MRVKLHFTLVGKSNQWKRNMPKGMEAEFSNSDTLSFVHDTVSDQFGDRALVIINEQSLKDDMKTYPEYYAAGWFVSEDGTSELVVVDHGDSMESASKAMINSVGKIDWYEFASAL